MIGARSASFLRVGLIIIVVAFPSRASVVVDVFAFVVDLLFLL